MTIKTPVSYDVSHWRPIPDFAALNPRPYLVLTKATEAVLGVDETFVKHFADMKQDGVYRGAYHFFRKFYDSTVQAKHFCDTVGPYIEPKDILVLDVEEGGETAAQLQAWFVYVQAKFPGNLPMIYSRKNILDAISMTLAQREYFKKIKVWTAGYPLDPDAYDSVPVYYIPDPTRWGPVWLWQYTEHGAVEGASPEGLDCNWVAPELSAWLGPSPEPPTTGDAMYDCKVKASATPYVNIRQFASGSSADIGNVYPGDTFQADRLENGFLHGVNPFIGYVSAQYVDYVEVDPPAINETNIKITYNDANTVTGVSVDGENWVKP